MEVNLNFIYSITKLYKGLDDVTHKNKGVTILLRGKQVMSGGKWQPIIFKVKVSDTTCGFDRVQSMVNESIRKESDEDACFSLVATEDKLIEYIFTVQVTHEPSLDSDKIIYWFIERIADQFFMINRSATVLREGGEQ